MEPPLSRQMASRHATFDLSNNTYDLLDKMEQTTEDEKFQENNNPEERGGSSLTGSTSWAAFAGAKNTSHVRCLPSSTRNCNSGGSWADIARGRTAQQGDQEMEDELEEQFWEETNGASTRRQHAVVGNKDTATSEELEAAFEAIPDTYEPLSGETVAQVILSSDAQQRMAKRLHRLNTCAVVLYLVDANPCRDKVWEWIKENIAIKTGVRIKQLRVLDRRHYLVVVSSEEDRTKVLGATPYYFNRRMVFVMPWKPGFTTDASQVRNVPVWVSIQSVDAMLEEVGYEMLGALGPVLHQSGLEHDQTNKYSNVRGCVLIDLKQELPSSVAVHLHGRRKALKVSYEKLPDACFTCHQRGHIAKFCPTTTATRIITDTNGNKTNDIINDEGFTNVQRGLKPKITTLEKEIDQETNRNRFDVLLSQQQEDANEETEVSPNNQEAAEEDAANTSDKQELSQKMEEEEAKDPDSTESGVNHSWPALILIHKW